MPFFTDKQGRVRPITPKKGNGGAVVAGVAVLGIVAGGGGATSVGLGTAGTASEVGVGSVRLGGSSGQLRARKDEGRRAARRGEFEGAWQRMGLRQGKRVARQQAECVTASFGQVRDLVDVHGSGDITPLGGELLGLGGITFTGLRYGSDIDVGGAGVTVAEAENAPGGQFDHDTLDAIAEVASYLPRT
ncbi:hypothetical protein [Saccharothrix sp. Mg75]|uniref:hypothetical protein n=1 Tax=Saccharothrix sp. Mg75 TaxID=3445357 RepID=UPI003EEE779B